MKKIITVVILLAIIAVVICLNINKTKTPPENEVVLSSQSASSGIPLYPGLTWTEETTKPHGVSFDQVEGPARMWIAKEGPAAEDQVHIKGFIHYYSDLLHKEGWSPDELVVNGKTFTAPRGEQGWSPGSWGYLKNENGNLRMIMLEADPGYSKWIEGAEGDAPTPECPCNPSYSIILGEVSLKDLGM
ncbi:MAG: hypothetical protein RJB39_265 [Candidatus Parcubacteria bacterium]|jgi:hypothetical protein